MDAPDTISNLNSFRSVQAGYQAYQNEPAPLNEHDLYECFVRRLLAYPDSPCENVGWVIGWVKGLLESASPHPVSPTSSGRRSEVPAPYGESALSATLIDENLYLPTTRPFCADLSYQCHDEPQN